MDLSPKPYQKHPDQKRSENPRRTPDTRTNDTLSPTRNNHNDAHAPYSPDMVHSAVQTHTVQNRHSVTEDTYTRTERRNSADRYNTAMASEFLKPFQPVKRALWVYPATFALGAILTWCLVNFALYLEFPVHYGFIASLLVAGFLALWVHGNFFLSVIDTIFDFPALLYMHTAQRWREFIMTMGLFTRLPLPEFEDQGKHEIQLIKPLNPVWAYPFVGFIIGLISASIILLCAALSIPTTLSAILALFISVLLTGSLHEDGLSDFLDGIGGGRTKEDKLRIMRDSRLGSYGGIAMIFSLAARVAAIASLAPLTAAAAVVAAHTIARGSLVLPLHWFPPARTDGVAVQASHWASGSMTAFVLVSSILLTMIVQPVPGTAFIAWLAGTLAIIFTVRYAFQKIGGYTGDVLGACEQFAEIAVLWSIAIFLVKTST